MLDGSMLFEEHTTKWNQKHANMLKSEQDPRQFLV